uniref:Guanylate-binding protein N-terminal domain-containing protein n=1 Tax=Rhizochromulina marina TaxID=1034831 RepID=A0A7S2S911_9STRA|mmetsp:Transcript_26874/g.78243  ORF Transcript_26874/g.78243 Transcript_26874/m.78243 type:complete len:556 (+) Transcript_26874:25-1692(+)
MAGPVLVLLALALCGGVSASSKAAPIHVVDHSGQLKSSSLRTATDGSEAADADKLSVLATIGAPGCGREALVNELFETSLEENNGLPGAGPKPLCTAAMGGQGVLVLSTDCDYRSDASTRDRVLALEASLADVVTFHLWESDVGRRVPANEAALRSLLSLRAQQFRKNSRKSLLAFVVHSAGPKTSSAASKVLLEDLSLLWGDLAAEAALRGEEEPPALKDMLQVQCFTLPPQRDAAGYTAAVDLLREKLVAGPALKGTFSKGVKATTAAEVADKIWKATGESASALPPRDELMGWYAIDRAYADAHAQAQGTLNGWRRSVEKGNRIGDFGDAASTLLESTLARFDSATEACSIGSRRKERRQELETTIGKDLDRMFQLQIGDLEKQTLRKFEGRLLSLLNGVKDAAAVPDEAGEAEVRKFAFDFGRHAARLVVPGVTGSEGAKSETDKFSETLTTFLQDFDESPPAKVLRLNRLERKVQRSRKAEKNPRSIVPGLHLSGMMRQIGVGNLQGFAGYTMGPHSVTMGYQNDRGSLESGDTSPLLRLQPKIHLDVDL